MTICARIVDLVVSIFGRRVCRACMEIELKARMRKSANFGGYVCLDCYVRPARDEK